MNTYKLLLLPLLLSAFSLKAMNPPGPVMGDDTYINDIPEEWLEENFRAEEQLETQEVIRAVHREDRLTTTEKRTAKERLGFLNDLMNAKHLRKNSSNLHNFLCLVCKAKITTPWYKKYSSHLFIGFGAFATGSLLTFGLTKWLGLASSLKA